MKYIPAIVLLIAAGASWLMSRDDTPGSASKANGTLRNVSIGCGIVGVLWAAAAAVL